LARAWRPKSWPTTSVEAAIRLLKPSTSCTSLSSGKIQIDAAGAAIPLAALIKGATHWASASTSSSTAPSAVCRKISPPSVRLKRTP